MPTTDQSSPSPYNKLKLKPGMGAFIYAVPKELRELLALPEEVISLSSADIGADLPASVDMLAGAEFALTFARNQSEAVRRIRELEPALLAGAVVWISYPKGSKAAGHDVSRDTIWRAANEAGSVLNANVSIDETWSAVRIRKAKPGELG